jgi:hypothetical protein
MEAGVVRGNVKRIQRPGWEYNCATMFLGDINLGNWLFILGGVSNETVKHGREF